jgi:hypothetical protein
MLRTPLVCVRFIRAGSVTYRVGVPTPYFMQTIADDVRRTGRVEVELAADADDAAPRRRTRGAGGARAPRADRPGLAPGAAA